MASRTCGSTGLTSSRTPAGGPPSAWSSIGSRRPRSPSRSSPGSIFIRDVGRWSTSRRSPSKRRRPRDRVGAAFRKKRGTEMQHEHTEHVAAPPDAVYGAISDVGNLPKFVPQLTGARDAGEGRIEVDARYQAREQHGEVSFQTDDSARRIEW